MRTTVRLDDRLLADAKRHAAQSGRTLTSLIDEGLRDGYNAKRRQYRAAFRVGNESQTVLERHAAPSPAQPVELPTGGGRTPRAWKWR